VIEPRRALHARIAETAEKQFAHIAESKPELLAAGCGPPSSCYSGWPALFGPSARPGRRCTVAQLACDGSGDDVEQPGRLHTAGGVCTQPGESNLEAD
jgi:hypothetical protein